MSDNVVTKNWRRPLLLRPDNFTPPQRTPWGGTRIRSELKAGLGLAGSAPVGESWELSVEPDFPSQLLEGPDLDAVLRSDPEALLGAEAAQGSTGLLVKLLDAAQSLSLQIHPRDDDPALAPEQSGKPEAWYVIDADPGAGLYLGLQPGASARSMRDAIESERDLASSLHFVPVAEGDSFVVEPGTPHAIGKGVLLLEPQRVLPGKRGITYRYWDWNRRYDSAGVEAPEGRPRELHVDRALEVTNWDLPRGEALLERIRHRAGSPRRSGDARLEVLVGPSGPLFSKQFDLQRLSGTGQVELPTATVLRALTVLRGRVGLRGEHEGVELVKGQTAALPACLHSTRAELSDAHAILSCLVYPR